jgi:hypothetical protein
MVLAAFQRERRRRRWSNVVGKTRRRLVGER